MGFEQEILKYSDVDKTTERRLRLYCHKAPQYLQEIAKHYNGRIEVFINWDVNSKHVPRRGFVIDPNENDRTDQISIFLNPYTLAWTKQDIEQQYAKGYIVDVRETIIWVLLHEIGHVVTKSLADKDANRWMIDQIREVKKNFPIPHLDRKGVSIDDFQLKPDESGNYR
ncbi:MAG: hypothetical protein KAW02_04460 [candidate division Zixibacteria bacterium]|nr:hypothetical protein [candidate division Zixibacteria bacterium]